jgi:simple sugar transport system substrate-binding protein/ribose transport system substrate-binding protein
MRKIVVMLCAAALVLGAVSCSKQTGGTSQAADDPAAPLVINGKQITVVYLANEASSAWQVASTGFLKTLIERAGGKCTVLTADLKPETQAQQAQDLLVSAPDFVVVKPTDSAAIVPAIRQLNEAGIPVLSIDVRPDSGCSVITHIQSDQLQLGGLGAQYLADMFRKEGKTGKVISIMGQLEIVLGRERQQGFEEAAAKNSDVLQMLDYKVEAKWANELAYTATKDGFTRYPDANAIFVMSDCMLVGVLQALRELDKLYPIGDPRHIAIASIDADENGIKAIRDGTLDVAVEHNAALHSDIATRVIVDYLHGKTIPVEIVFEPFVVTKANVDDPARWGAADLKTIGNWPPMKHDRYISQYANTAL